MIESITGVQNKRSTYTTFQEFLAEYLQKSSVKWFLSQIECENHTKI
jgi:hypothetical protein